LTVAFILDTDHISVLHHETQPAFGRLQARLQQHASEVVQVTIVSFQEQVQGWLAYINKTRNANQVLRGYAKLLGLLEDYSEAFVLPFDQAALDRFNYLHKLRVRLGTLDLRIAAIALATDSVPVTRNMRDFRNVQGLKLEDWTE
jgi:tRNA(fMet)-specific endonuclease VapC